MRTRLALLFAAAVFATGTAEAAAADLDPHQPVFYAGGQPVYSGVVYSGQIGNLL